MIFLIFLPCLVILITTIYLSRNNNYWKKRKIPFIEPKLIFGNMFNVFVWKQNIGEFLKDKYEKHKDKPFIGMHFFDEPCLLINDLDLIKKILIEDFEDFPNRTAMMNPKDDPIGSKFLFFMNEPLWRPQRKYISPLFSSGKLKAQTKNFPSLIQSFIESVKEELKINKVIEVKTILDKLTISSVSKSFYGLENNVFENNEDPFLEVSKRLLNWKALWHALQSTYMFIAPNFVNIFRMVFVDKFSTELFRKTSWHLINLRENSNFKNNDVIDILVDMKKKENITQSDSIGADMLASLFAQVFTAGYVSSSTTISFCLFELAKNPTYQNLARLEVMKIKKIHGDFTYAALHDLKYVKQCFDETLRMYPIDPFLDRKSIREYKIPGTDIVLEKGQSVYISVWGIHLDPNYYPEPLKFDPDRFSEENQATRSEFVFLPFGSGPRKCPGIRFSVMNSLSALANILSNFEVKLPEGSKDDDIEMNRQGFLLQPKDGIFLEFIDLKNEN